MISLPEDSPNFPTQLREGRDRSGRHPITPPRDSQPPQALPSHHLCHIAPSSPRANTSSRFAPHETAVGGPTIMPPSDSQPPQAKPFHHLCQRAPSVPWANTSRRLLPHETTFGSPMITP